jgi:integrase
MTFRSAKDGRKAKGLTVVEIGRAEPGVQDWLDSRGTTNDRSFKVYRGLIGMIRRRSPRPLLELSQNEARVLAQEIKRLGSAQILCGHVRSFFKFHGRDDLAKHFNVRPKSNAIGADAIPTDEQVNSLIAAAPFARDRALVASLFECGVRISELLGVRLKDVTIVDSPQNGGKKFVKIWFRLSKVQGEQHSFVLIDSAPLILKWIEAYPLPRQNGEAPLFPSSSPGNYGGVMERSAFGRILKSIAKDAGQDPTMYHAHMARHYAATRMLRSGISETMVKKSLGWSPSSRMLSRYSHVVAQDAENAYFVAHGMEVAEVSKPEGFTIPGEEVPAMPEAPEHQYVDLKDPAALDEIKRQVAKEILEGAAEMMRAEIRKAGLTTMTVLNRPLTREEVASGKYATVYVEDPKKDGK